MSWFGYFLVMYWAANAVFTIAFVGRKREPLTPTVAAGMVVIYGLLIWGVIAVGTTS